MNAEEIRCDDGAVEDLLGRFEIALGEERRDIESFAVGVEAGATGAVVGEDFRDVEVDTEEVADSIAILAAVEATEGYGSCKIPPRAGSQAEALVNPVGNAEAVVFGEFRITGRHGAVAELGGDIAPKSAVSIDIFSRGGFEEVDVVLWVGRVVAGAAIPGKDRADCADKFVGRRLARGQAGGQQNCKRGKTSCEHAVVTRYQCG